MEEFVKGEEKTYIVQVEPVEKENNQKQEQQTDKDDITEKTSENVTKDDAKENDNEEGSHSSVQETSSQEMQEESFHKPPQKIEVVTGDANHLKISNVADYFEVQKPKEENIKGHIIIPEEKK